MCSNIAFEPLPIKTAISLINKAGGRAVVAHLPTLGPKWREKFAPEYVLVLLMLMLLMC